MRWTKTGHGRVLGFDLESRPQAFWYDGNTTAEITAFAWKWTDEPDVHTLLLLNNGRFITDDGKKIAGDRAYGLFRDTLAGAALVFGHNIRRFDLPLFNAGLLRRSLPILPRLLTVDTLRDYPRRKDMSASLENLVKQYGLDDGGGKLHMSIADWEQANRLMPDGVRLTRERVVSDVLLQERLREHLMGLGLLGDPKGWSP